jgi:hypothetical protein
MGKRRCQGTTKASKPCAANPLTDSNFCLAHSDAETRESVGFIPDNGKGGRPRNPRAVDVLRKRLEADIERVLKPLFDGLEASKGITLAIGGGKTELVETPDHALRLAAVRELLDRAYGKPKQATELTGPEGGPVQVEGSVDLRNLSPTELRELRALLARASGDDAAQP